MAEKIQNKKYDITIDIYKVILVVGMIFAHVIQFSGNLNSPVQKSISDFINLITFSGFMFSFGYVCNIAYFSKERKNVRNSLIKNCIKLIIVYYISGICYQVFVKKVFNLTILKRIILIKIVSPYSEFLLSFALLNLFILVMFNAIKIILRNKYFTIVSILISLAFTVFPYELIDSNLLGVFIGTYNYPCFPIIQYFGYFIFGAYINMNKEKNNYVFLSLCILGSALYELYIKRNSIVPKRFPPTALWISGAAAYIYIYYLVSKYIKENVKAAAGLIRTIGSYTIYYLLLSNVIIFILSNYFKKIRLFKCSIITIAIILFIMLVISTVKIIVLSKQKKLER